MRTYSIVGQWYFSIQRTVPPGVPLNPVHSETSKIKLRPLELRLSESLQILFPGISDLRKSIDFSIHCWVTHKADYQRKWDWREPSDSCVRELHSWSIPRESSEVALHPSLTQSNMWRVQFVNSRNWRFLIESIFSIPLGFQPYRFWLPLPNRMDSVLLLMSIHSRGPQ